ncbi:MAG: FG-GAP repeat protein [Deltaproteobacteria bacterium]|nr:FG-GAP repeat protein [Deltaproteobacteria bacterium]
MVFETPAGRRLRYGALWAKDATGRELPSELRLAAVDRIRIEVDDRDAVYPIVIDPLLGGGLETGLYTDQPFSPSLPIALGFGAVALSAGDVNGDFYDDVIVSAWDYDTGVPDGGAAFIFHGGPTGVADADASMAATRIESDQANAGEILIATSAGDVNGDGFGDVIIGVPNYDAGETNEGAAFLFHGGPGGIPSATFAGAATRIESDQTGAFMGVFSLGGPGDYNADGYDDVVVSALSYDVDLIDEGAAFVFMGGPTGIASGNPSTAAAQIQSTRAGLRSFFAQHAGDVNGDGYSDLLISSRNYVTFGAPGFEKRGAGFVFHGSAAGISSGNPSTANARLQADSSDDLDFFDFSPAGDTNGDGYADLSVGLIDGAPSDPRGGAIFLGGPLGIGDRDPSAADTILTFSSPTGGFNPWSVYGVADVNGDGYGDVAASGNGFDLIFLGSPTGIADGNERSADIRTISGASAGDVNADGFDDLIIACPSCILETPGYVGAAFVDLGGPKVWTQTYAFVFADQQSAASYTPNSIWSFNPAASAPTLITRTAIGNYSVDLPGFESINGRGNVQVSQSGSGSGYCKVAFWSEASVFVRCFDAAGSPSDQRFTLLYLKSDFQNTSTFFAWANDPTDPSYAPAAEFAFSPDGSSGIDATRASTGNYTMRWPDAGDFGDGGGHAQVTAYGSDNVRCKVGNWGPDDVNVRCFDAAGNPADSRYSVLYVRPSHADEGLAFAWANQLTLPSYAPFALYTFHPSGGSVTATRSGAGTYAMTFSGFAGLGFDGGHVQVSAYGTDGDTRCGVASWNGDTVEVNCRDSAGALADSAYAVMYIRPIAVPEPTIASMLAVGLAFAAMRKRMISWQARERARTTPVI